VFERAGGKKKFSNTLPFRKVSKGGMATTHVVQNKKAQVMRPKGRAKKQGEKALCWRREKVDCAWGNAWLDAIEAASGEKRKQNVLGSSGPRGEKGKSTFINGNTKSECCIATNKEQKQHGRWGGEPGAILIVKRPGEGWSFCK